MGRERHSDRYRDMQKSGRAMWKVGWERRGIQGKSGDQGSEVGVHLETLGKSKEATVAGSAIKVI